MKLVIWKGLLRRGPGNWELPGTRKAALTLKIVTSRRYMILLLTLLQFRLSENWRYRAGSGRFLRIHDSTS